MQIYLFFAIINKYRIFWGNIMINFKYFFMAVPLVFALNINAQSFDALEEVAVTAQKKEENLQETPIAITAITESAIDDLDIANVVDLAGMAPNVHIINTPSNNTAATIAMRGGVTINPAITWEPTVGMYLDGVYLGKVKDLSLMLLILERVEIPQGSSRNTFMEETLLGGAINLISKKPSGEGMSAKVTIGNYGLKQSQLIADYEELETVCLRS